MNEIIRHYRKELPVGWVLIWVMAALAFFAAPVRPATTPAVVANRAERQVKAVEAIGMTVSDMDRAIDFYTRVLSFVKVSDVEVAGEDVERLEGVFGSRIRVVRMKLGDETIELSEYLAPRGRPIP